MYTKRRPNSADWLPMFYVYDSYQIKAADWSRVLSSDSELRSSQDYNAIVIGLLLKTDNLLVGFKYKIFRISVSNSSTQ